MDGTLYDEFDFICQVYKPIAKIFSNSNDDVNKTVKSMLLNWMEKGSSYPFIFSETLEKSGIEIGFHEKKIEEALSIFRNFEPDLILSERMKLVLGELKKKYELFLVSDGSSKLQWNKIKALQLENYFSKENIFISGDYGKGAGKQELVSLNHLEVFKKNIKRSEVVFIGDRMIDENYARNAGFLFVNINSLFNKK